MKKTINKSQKTQLLRQVGWWATLWWAFSGLYLVLIVWMAKDAYVGDISWQQAIGRAFADQPILTWLFWLLAIGWAIGAVVWLKALKRAKISLRDGLKDLFLTLR